MLPYRAANLHRQTARPRAAGAAKDHRIDLARRPDYRRLPPGPGREEVFYTCTACHSIMLVRQQRLRRDVWDETLDWMVEEQDMPELDPDQRKVTLDYLST